VSAAPTPRNGWNTCRGLTVTSPGAGVTGANPGSDDLASTLVSSGVVVIRSLCRAGAAPGSAGVLGAVPATAGPATGGPAWGGLMSLEVASEYPTASNEMAATVPEAMAWRRDGPAGPPAVAGIRACLLPADFTTIPVFRVFDWPALGPRAHSRTPPGNVVQI